MLLSPALDPAPLRRPAAVVRYRSHVSDAGDFEPESIERAHGGFASGARTLDPYLQVLDAAFLRRPAGRFRCDLRRERSGLARALETGAARGCPRQRVALPVRDRDDRVVERRVNVRDPFGYVLLDLLARARSGRRGLL